MNSRHLAFALAALLPAACSSPSSSTRAIAGRVDTSQFQLQNASAVAVSSSQHVYRAPVAADGSFSIAVPVGSTYSLHFANATASPTMLDSFATLAPLTAQGTRTHWFHVTEGGTIQLGLVGVPRAAKSGADDGTATDSTDDSSTDASEGEHDDDEVCDLSGGSDDQEVDGEHDLMQENDSDHDGLDDSADTEDDRGACADSHDDGDDCALSGEQEQENEQEGDDACAATGTAPVPGSTPAAP